MLTATCDIQSIGDLAAASEAARLKGDYQEGALLAREAGNPLYENTMQYAILRREWPRG